MSLRPFGSGSTQCLGPGVTLSHVTADAPQIDHFLKLWFGPQAANPDDPGLAVAPILRFNRAVTGTFDGNVEVLVVEQQGVWLWGKTADGRYVERANAPDAAWRDVDEDAEAFWLHHAAVDAAMSLGASRSAQRFDAATIEAIRGAASPMPCGTWTWPGTSQAMFYRGASVIMICQDGKDFWVVASATVEEDLNWLDDLQLRWDELDTRVQSDGS